MMDTYMDTKQFASKLNYLQVTDILGGGGRICTFDLRVMSPTSYLTAPPRYKKNKKE